MTQSIPGYNHYV